MNTFSYSCTYIAYPYRLWLWPELQCSSMPKDIHCINKFFNVYRILGWIFLNKCYEHSHFPLYYLLLWIHSRLMSSIWWLSWGRSLSWILLPIRLMPKIKAFKSTLRAAGVFKPPGKVKSSEKLAPWRYMPSGNKVKYSLVWSWAWGSKLCWRR